MTNDTPTKKTKEGRSYSWAYTLNNYTDNDIEWLQTVGCRRHYCSKEIGDKGTPHLQGGITFEDKHGLSGLKKLHGRISWHKSSAKDISWYPNKVDSEPCIDIDNRKQGARTDLEKLKNDIVAGKPVDDIVLETPHYYHQYGRTLDRIEDIVMRSKFRTEMTKGIWIWGSSGIGKSHIAHEGYNTKDFYTLCLKDNGYWGGYTQQETVIIEDLKHGQLKFSDLCTIVDKWPYSVPRKKRETTPFLSKRVIITSSYAPEVLYSFEKENEDWYQFERRFEVVHKVPVK